MSDIKYTAFKTRIYPTKEQEEYFNKCFGITRFTYNWYVEKKSDCLKNNIKKSFYTLKKEFNSGRDNYPFVLDINYNINVSALSDANEAFNKFFKKVNNYPKFKSKKNKKQSFSTDRCIIF